MIHYPSDSNVLEVPDGEVYFNVKSFKGSNVPFDGYVSDGIREIFLDGKKVKFNGNEDLFFRQNIKWYSGYNKIPVRIVGNSGNTTDGWLVIEIEL